MGKNYPNSKKVSKSKQKASKRRHEIHRLAEKRSALLEKNQEEAVTKKPLSTENIKEKTRKPPASAGSSAEMKRISGAENSLEHATKIGLQKAEQGAGAWKNDKKILARLTELGLRSVR